MTSRRLIPILVLALSLLPTQAAFAKTYVSIDKDVSREERTRREFRLSGDQKLKLTLSAKMHRAGHLRIYFHQRDSAGRWVEVDKLRVDLRSDTDTKTAEFELPAGSYKVEVSIRRCIAQVKLEDG